MKTIIAPAVLVTALALQKVRHWTEMARGEFSALGTVEIIGGQLLITDVFLVDQVSGPASTEMTVEGVAKLLIDVEKAGEDSGQLRCWIHAHPGDVYWSQTDETCIRGLDNGQWLLSWVCNKAGEDRLRLDVFEPVRLTLDRLKLQIHVDDLDLHDWCAEQFAKKVDERPTMFRRGTRSGCLVNHHRRLQPPWPTDEETGEDDLLPGPTEDDWWDDDGWALADDDQQLRTQLDDPWNACMALGVR